MQREQFVRDYGQGPGYGSVGEDNNPRVTNQPSYMEAGYLNFDEMCEEISKKIYLINSGATKLEKTTQLIGTDKDSVKIRDRVHEASMSTHRLVTEVMGLLKRLSKSRQTDRLKQVQIDRLTTEFQDSVQRFTSFQKYAAEKVRMTGDVRERTLPDEGDDYNDRSALLQEGRLSQLQNQGNEIDEDLELVRDREERIRQLEADVLDVNEIFRDLGAMIHEQGTTIDLIESNVETAYSAVDAGTTQLNKASNYQKKARKKMCICLIILLVVAGILALILGLTLRK